ncbi:MAG TPA: anhydro-N-acetylmuramic acid kinase [Candidatus Tumulicola sp.]|nr:anhydro-N-acetylmuramic acid kinase [Candidatus Tumulicola sp.]
MSSSSMRIIGLMSGTSLDGIDAAAIDVDERDGRLDLKLVAFATTPYAPALHAQLRAAMPPAPGSTAEVSRLHASVGEAFASAALALADHAGFATRSVQLIGSHGHTLFHDGRGPQPSTLQIGAPAIIAARTGVTTVGDFRAADIAAGGQGAPLVPYVDHLLLRDDAESRAVVNVGGIANVTLLPAKCGVEAIRGYDTGPGNMLIDECVRLATHGKDSMDVDGALAGRGRVSDALLEWLLQHPFFALSPPKSSGREDFGSDYARVVWERAASRSIPEADIVATVTKLTAVTIAKAVPHDFSRVIISGGGAHNATLRRFLVQALAARDGVAVSVDDSDAFGLPVDAKEAIAFALLARATVRIEPANIPAVTGARKRVVLGAIYPAKNYATLKPKNVVPGL